MTAFAGGKIECFCGPTEKGAQDDLETMIVGFIDAAVNELQVAVQELDNEKIARALVDAKLRRGVDVEVFLEQDYLVESWTPAQFQRMRTGGESEADTIERIVWGTAELPLDANRRLLGALQRANIDVKADLNPAIFHQKFIVRDVHGGAGTAPALLSGSANFTDTDTHANLNHVVVFHDQRIAQEYYAQFNQLRAGEFGRRSLGLPPRDYMVDGVPVRILFAPDNVPELELIKQMLKLRRLDAQLDFAIFTFSNSSAVDEALSMLARAGCRIRGVLDRGQNRTRTWSGAWRLRGEANVVLFLPAPDWHLRKLHHKLMVIDEATVCAGSFNYTADANDFNDENLFVMGSADPKVGDATVDAAACAQIAGYFRAEIERIIGRSEPWTPP